MGDLSGNFSRREFACECGCGLDTVDARLLFIMQASCDHFAQVLGVKKVVATVTGPNRCKKHNAAVQKSLGLPDNDSMHSHCRAADYRIAGVKPKQLYDYLDREFGEEIGLGLYSNRVHVDSRGHKARW